MCTCLHEFMCTTHVHSIDAQEGNRIPWNWSDSGFKLPGMGCWELNLDPLQEL